MNFFIRAMVILFLAVPVASSGADKASSAGRDFTGLVIDFSDDYVELKKGDRELKLYRTPETVVENNTGGEGDIAVALCQKARAVYVKDNHKARLVKLQILEPGYCGN